MWGTPRRLGYLPRDAHFSTYRAAIMSVFGMTVLVGPLLSIKLINVLGVILPAGTIIFPLSYECLVILSEVYGMSVSWRIAASGSMMLAMTTAMLTLVNAIPHVTSMGYHEHYRPEIFTLSIRLFASTTASFPIGVLAGYIVLRYALKYFPGTNLITRFILAPAISSAVTSSIFIYIAFLGSYGIRHIVALIVVRALISFTYAAAWAPIVMAASFFIREVEIPRPLPFDRPATIFGENRDE